MTVKSFRRAQLFTSLILFYFLLAACTPAHLVRLNMPPESERAEVFIHRDAGFNAGAIGVIFGADNKDVVQLNTEECARIFLPAGNHVLFVRSIQADKPFELAVSLTANKKTCFKAKANPSNFAKTLMPISFHLSSSFLLEPVNCLSDNEIAKYTLIPIEYEK